MSLILFLQWIINNFIYYGVGLKSSDLGLNPYLTFAISAFSEIVAYLISHAVLDIFGRKLPYVISLGMAGIACFSVGYVCKCIFIYVIFKN